ncbi:uncharacterized protein BX663DRAFT_256281 [Cokeromyces recurvatus]|uniref:uncharacterized protein n=1 Tax=Cokeromyces recurvatus TaxID=90255 RepID=UPI00221EF961|nr:uncharacterized protein BX663DRAFT_256281 [Cokeromyces recurvatus]KAI7906217.1 hypothetical protein BX663DRAFT_256281 [Cokeromyces recurvatus]
MIISSSSNNSLLKFKASDHNSSKDDNPRLNNIFSSSPFLLLSSDMIVSQQNTVLAWLQKELTIYIDLNFIPSIPHSSSSTDDWLGEPLVCLAHRFFPAALKKFDQALSSSSSTTALELFKSRWHIKFERTSQVMHYFNLIKTHVEQHRSLATSMELDVLQQHILAPLNKLYHQLVITLPPPHQQESLSTANSPPPPPPPQQQQYSNHKKKIEAALKKIEQQHEWLLFQQTMARCQLQDDDDNTIQLAIQISTIDATYKALCKQLYQQTAGEEEEELSSNTTTTHHSQEAIRVEFTTMAASIHNELEFIQAKMLKTTTSEVSIRDLEERCDKIKQVIQNVLPEHEAPSLSIGDQDNRGLLEKYQRIAGWVKDVRIWFLEAERIRVWIEERIHKLEGIASLSYLEEVECEWTLEQVHEWNEAQRELEEQVELFNTQDIARLRTHVKQLTSGQTDLSPADTTTIEITFTTLMTLDRLMHLLQRRHHELQMTTLRLRWEEAYSKTIVWTRTMTDKIKSFTERARWKPTIDNIVTRLVQFEHQLSSFDQDQVTKTINLYQEMDDTSHIELPNHLESRQVALEEALQYLTQRLTFARQVVEQTLMAENFFERSEELRQEGEALCHEMMMMTTTAPSSSIKIDECNMKVTAFQESIIRLVTMNIPYPEEIITGLFSMTQQAENEEANERIQRLIEDRKSALTLLNESLKQSLVHLRRTLQLQKRSKQLQDEIVRLGSWVDERLKSIDHVKLDVFSDNKCALDETDLARLKRERDGQVVKLKGIKENEYQRLQEHVQELKQVHLLELLETLDDQLNTLEYALSKHSDRIDILEQRIYWESQHAKASLWISTTTFEVWDFISRRAQWRSVDDLALTRCEFEDLQDNIQRFHVDELQSANILFNKLVCSFESFSLLDKRTQQQPNTPERVQRRQDALTQSFQNLCDLVEFANAVLQQRRALIHFSSRVNQLQDKGQAILKSIQQAITTIMTFDHNNNNNESLEDDVKEFGKDIIQLWLQSGSQLPYPTCPEDARSTRPSTEDDNISFQVANTVNKIYTELQELYSKQLTVQLQKLQSHLEYRSQVEEWCQQTKQTIDNIKKQTRSLSEYSFDSSTAIILHSGKVVDIDSCRHLNQSVMEDNVNQLVEQWKALRDVKSTHVDLHALTEGVYSDLKTATEALLEAQNQFNHCFTKCEIRLRWQKLWKQQWLALQELSESINEWDKKRSLSIDLVALEDEMQGYQNTIMEYIDQQASLESLYDALLKDKDDVSTKQQQDLYNLTSRLQESIHDCLVEIRKLQQYYKWEQCVNNELKVCEELVSAIEKQIETDFRWSSTNHHTINEEQLASLNVNIDKEIDTLNILSNDVSAQSQDERLKTAQTQLKNHKLYLNQVVKQHTIVCHVLNRIHDIESIAERVKTQLLVQDHSPNMSKILKDYKEHVEQIDDYTKQVMIYPIYYRNEKDAAHNAIIQDMLIERQSHLTELGNTLETIVQSREHMSRCKAAEASYFTEAEVVSNWISERRKQLERRQYETIEDLRIAIVHHTKPIQSTCIQSLKNVAHKYVSIIQDEGNNDLQKFKTSIIKSIMSRQATIELDYEQLVEDIAEYNQRLSKELHHKELLQLQSQFESQCEALRKTIETICLDDISEQVAIEWQANYLKDLEIVLEQIKTRMSSTTTTTTTIVKQFDVLQHQVKERIKVAHHHRLKKEYFTVIDSLNNFLKNVKDQLCDLQQNCPLIIQDSSKDNKKRLEAITIQISNIDKDFNHYYEHYTKLNLLNQLLQDSKVNKSQTKLEQRWQYSKIQIGDSKYHLANFKQWVELHTNLDNIRDNSLKDIQDQLQVFDPTDTATYLDVSLLDTLRHSLDSYQQTASHLPVDKNSTIFKQRHDELMNKVEDAQTKVDQHQAMIRQYSDFVSCQESVRIWCRHALDEVQAILLNDNHQLVGYDDLETQYTHIIKAFSIRENTYQTCVYQLKTVIQPHIDSFTGKYETKDIQQQLTESVEKWQDTIAKAHAAHEIMKSVIGHSKSAYDIRSWLDSCQLTITNLNTKQTVLGVDRLTQKMTNFEKVIISFRDISEKLLEKEEGWINDIVRATADKVENQWISTRDALKQLKESTDELIMIQTIGQIKDLVDDTKRSVESIVELPNIEQLDKEKLLSLPRKIGIQNVQKQLNEKEQEMIPQIENEIEKLNKTILSGNATCKQSFEELKQEMTSLKDKFVEKYKMIESFMLFGSYLTQVDEICILQSSLEEAINRASPQHSNFLVNSRVDLQAKLIELEARFKYYDQRINQHLQESQSLAQKIQNTIVNAYLAEMKSKQAYTQQQYKTRKIELSRINTLDNFKNSNQQRLRKSSLPTRKASSLLMKSLEISTSSHVVGHPVILNPRFTSRSGSSSGSSSNHDSSRYLSLPPRQSSKSATNLKTTSTASNMYVADPDNILDIEIGRIVNETPYHIKVKMVPGEVGRYWFGNVNPKLCYCRVLKSKMVMVRVGGGWTELSQFLRDHALFEGEFIPKREREQQSKSPTFQEGFIETQRVVTGKYNIDNNKRMMLPTSNSSSSTTTQQIGYKEGDKFIAVDSMGNQLEVQMKKVPSNYIAQSNSSTISNHTNNYTKKRLARKKEKNKINEPNSLNVNKK